MSQNVNLKEREQEAYMHYHQDGLLDIFIGLGILAFGLGMFIDQPWLGGIYPAIIVPTWRSAKKRITAPRTGDVQLAPAQREKLILLGGISAGVLTLALVLGIVVLLGQSTENTPPWLLTLFTWLREYFMLAFGLFGAFLMSASALVTRFHRLYAYAVLTMAVFAGGYLLNASFPLSVTLMGCMILLSGLVVLYRFKRNHPVLEDKQSG